MTLSDFMVSRGWSRGGSTKVICPFHGDRHPSAIMNPNSIYCFSEGRLYTLWDFQQAFGVILDSVPEAGSDQLSRIKGVGGYSYNDVLFFYDFVIRDF
jgi:hypothetical protein